MTDWTCPAPRAVAICKRFYPACERCPIIGPCHAPLQGPSSVQAVLDQHSAQLEAAAEAVDLGPP